MGLDKLNKFKEFSEYMSKAGSNLTCGCLGLIILAVVVFIIIAMAFS